MNEYEATKAQRTLHPVELPARPAQARHISGLHALVALRHSDNGEESQRTVPRFVFEPVHAFVVIVVLVIALAANITLLLIQGVSLRTLDTQSVSSAPVASATPNTENESAPSSTGKPQEESSGNDQTNAHTQSAPLVNINTATQSDLETISGVGPVTAQRIIEYRQSNGFFTSVDDLLNVRGIGTKTLENMRPFVTVH